VAEMVGISGWQVSSFLSIVAILPHLKSSPLL
jgi:hypothetical protein